MIRFLYNADGGASAPAPEPQAAPVEPAASQATEPAQDENPWKGHWASQLPKEFLTDHKDDLLDMKSKGLTIKDVVDEVLTHRKNSSRSIVVPGKDAKPEEIQAFLKRMDIPEGPDGYGLKHEAMGEWDKDGAFTKKLSEDMRKHAISKKQAAWIYETFANTAKGISDQIAAKSKADAENFDSRFAELYEGDEKKTTEAKEYFKRFMISIGDKEVLKKLKDTGVLYDPKVAAAFSAYHKAHNAEPPYIDGHNPGAQKKGSGGFAHGGDFEKEFGPRKG